MARQQLQNNEVEIGFLGRKLSLKTMDAKEENKLYERKKDLTCKQGHQLKKPPKSQKMPIYRMMAQNVHFWSP